MLHHAAGIRMGYSCNLLARPGSIRRFNHTLTGNTFFGMLDPFARHLVQIPELVGLLDVGLAHPYTYSVMGMTVILRSLVTLPVAFWQKRRTDRLSNIVLPEFRVWKQQIPASIWHRASMEGSPSPEDEQQVQRKIRKSLSQKWKHLIMLYNCSPTKTAFVSMAIHIPLFLMVSWLLRQGAVLDATPLINEIIPWWSPDEIFSIQAENTRQLLLDKGLDPGLADRLTKLGGPTLADRDPTFIMPLVCGSLNMVNVEIVNWMRQRQRLHEMDLGLNELPESQQQEEPLRARLMSNILRISAIASIPIACQVPSVLLVYWSTSSLITFAQHVYFAREDAKG